MRKIATHSSNLIAIPDYNVWIIVWYIYSMRVEQLHYPMNVASGLPPTNVIWEILKGKRRVLRQYNIWKYMEKNRSRVKKAIAVRQERRNEMVRHPEFVRTELRTNSEQNCLRQKFVAQGRNYHEARRGSCLVMFLSNLPRYQWNSLLIASTV